MQIELTRALQNAKRAVEALKKANADANNARTAKAAETVENARQQAAIAQQQLARNASVADEIPFKVRALVVNCASKCDFDLVTARRGVGRHCALSK